MSQSVVCAPSLKDTPTSLMDQSARFDLYCVPEAIVCCDFIVLTLIALAAGSA